MHAGDHHNRLVRRELHDFTGRQQRPRRFLAAHHQMTEPWRKTMPGIVLHGAHLRRGPECIRYPLGRALIVGRERDANMAIVEDRMVRAIGAFELVQALRDQKTADTVPRHECELALKEVEATERRELIE